GAGDDRLNGGAGEPVDDGATADQAEEERRIEDREVGDRGLVAQAVGEDHDDREQHGGRPDDGRADEDGLGGGFERVAGAVVLFQQELGALEVDIDAHLASNLFGDAGDLFDEREFVYGLGVVGDRAIGVDGDRDRAHPEEAEGDQPEREDGDGGGGGGGQQ